VQVSDIRTALLSVPLKALTAYPADTEAARRSTRQKPGPRVEFTAGARFVSLLITLFIGVDGRVARRRGPSRTLQKAFEQR
jgi:hypothetical protein